MVYSRITASPMHSKGSLGLPRPLFEIHPNFNLARSPEIPVILQHTDGRHLMQRRMNHPFFPVPDGDDGDGTLMAENRRHPHPQAHAAAKAPIP